MKKTKTLRALLMSALAMILCVSMLVGSTFAWFTDSVVSANNVIKSGNLDVAMQWADGKNAVPAVDSAEWIDASTGPIFNYDLWEPGYTVVRHVQIANKGSLALKYQLNMAANGEISKLAEVIDVYYADPAVQIKNRAELANVQPMATLDQALGGMAQTAYGELLPGEVHTVTIALKMKETAGNEYQNLSIGADFSVILMATQLTAEKDSFDDQYDAAATYLNQDADGAWLINNMDELFFFANDVNSGKTYKGEIVKLTADVDVAGYKWIPIQKFAGTFEGNGKTISNLSIKGGSSVAFFKHIQSTAKVQNVTFDKAKVSGEHYVAVVLAYESNENTNALIKNVKVTNSTVTGAVVNNDNGDKIGAIVGYAVTLNIENCSVENTTVTGYRDVGGIIGYAHKNVVVKNNTVKDSQIVCDASVNYKNYTKADEYDVEAIVGEAVSTAIIENNTVTDVDVVAPQDVVSVGTAEDLQQMLSQLTTSGAGDNVLNITSDIDIGSAQWESVTVQGYTGAGVITVNGNGHTITGLNAPLFTGGFAGGSGIIIKDLTIKNAKFDVADKYSSTGAGAFICAVDSMQIITLTNCHLIDSEITGSRTGGLIGWTSGYNVQNDGPVDTKVTIKDCSVIGCKITGYGTVGAINGHAGANPATYTTIEDCVVKDNTLISYDDSYRVGVVLGTANVGQVTIDNINESGNTVKQIDGSTEIARPAGQSSLYGRTAFGSTGSMTIDGVAVQ